MTRRAETAPPEKVRKPEPAKPAAPRLGMTQCRECARWRAGRCEKFNLDRRAGNGCTMGEPSQLPPSEDGGLQVAPLGLPH